MKKYLSILLAVLMLISTMPIASTASEQNTSRQDYLIELACKTFPEYASNIRGESVTSYASPRSNNSNEVIFSETRAISDTQTLNIAQLASGEVIITSGNVEQFPIEISDDTVSDISNVGVSGSATFEVTSNEGLGTFTLSNVRFTIYYYASDYFTNTGSCSYDENVSANLQSSSTTLIHYHVTFNMAGATKQPIGFTLNFSNNQLVAEVG